MDINNIVSTTTITIDKLKDYKNGGNALFLYFDYIKHSRIQKTNQIWCNDEFMMKSIKWGVEKFRGAKNLLKKLGLIEVIQERGNNGKLGKYYIKIHFLIGEEKREKSIKPESGEIQTSVKPESGEIEVNALRDKIKMLEKENKMLKDTFSKEKEETSIVKIDKRDMDIDLIIETIKNINGGITDDSVKKQRQYGKLIKDKMNKIVGFNGDFAGFINYAYENSDGYRKNHFRSLEKFYFNITNIIAGLKQKVNMEKKETILFTNEF